MSVSPHDDHHHEVECANCRLDFDFDLPRQLVEAAHRRDVVIFAGAGVSTEVPPAFPVTIMARAAELLGRDDLSTFPATMQAFQDKFGRTEMVQMIKAKFDYIDSFRSLRWHARKFHRELATMPYLEDIVTTNWDTFFEQECDATPFISGEDIALWKMAGRKVLKIHGSISNLASIVATEDDYARCLDGMNSNLMGSLLRNFLATKTVVFIGYSLSDWNFRWLYEALISDMNEFAPRAYFVSPFGIDAEDEKTFRLKTIQTSGVKFLQELKQANYGHCFIKDSNYERVATYAQDISEAERFAKTLSHKEFPAVIYSWAFHDGAQDACYRIMIRRPSGEYSSRQYVRSRIDSYEILADQAWENEQYWDHAYIEGYATALFIMLDDYEDMWEEHGELLESAPRYLAYGLDDNKLQSREDFLEAMTLSRRRATKQRMAARKITDNIPEGMIITHEPFLKGLPSENDPLENEHA